MKIRPWEHSKFFLAEKISHFSSVKNDMGNASQVCGSAVVNNRSTPWGYKVLFKPRVSWGSLSPRAGVGALGIPSGSLVLPRRAGVNDPHDTHGLKILLQLTTGHSLRCEFYKKLDFNNVLKNYANN